MICDQIKARFIDTGDGATRNDIARVATEVYMTLEVDEFRRDRFCASNSFVDAFLKRNHLSLRSPHVARRPKVNVDKETEFIERISTILNDYPQHRLYNIDETCWKLIQTPRRIIAPIGCENVKLETNVNDKASVTAIAVIVADGRKLPIRVIARGKTAVCTRKYGEHHNCIVHFF